MRGPPCRGSVALFPYSRARTQRAHPWCPPRRPGPAGLCAPRRLAELPGPAERRRRRRCWEPLGDTTAGRSAALPPTGPETLSSSRPAVAFFFSLPPLPPPFIFLESVGLCPITETFSLPSFPQKSLSRVEQMANFRVGYFV